MNENIANEVVEVEALLLSRAYLYTLFHKLLGGYPSEELVEAATSPMTLDVVDEYADDVVEMAGLREFLGKVTQEAADAKAFVGDLSGEYTRLFVGPGRPEALPIESPYVTNEATYFQENTLRVRETYRAHGLEPRRVGHTPDDHIAIECAFMAELAMRLLSTFRQGDLAGFAEQLRDCREFSVAHLSWTSDLAVAARHGKTARFYPQMAEALAAFVKVDTVFLSESQAWAEELPRQGEFESFDCAERPESFAAVEKAIASLGALRLFGLEENELVVLGS